MGYTHNLMLSTTEEFHRPQPFLNTLSDKVFKKDSPGHLGQYQENKGQYPQITGPILTDYRANTHKYRANAPRFKGQYPQIKGPICTDSRANAPVSGNEDRLPLECSECPPRSPHVKSPNPVLFRRHPDGFQRRTCHTTGVVVIHRKSSTIQPTSKTNRLV
jgi:hypothetical protein